MNRKINWTPEARKNFDALQLAAASSAQKNKAKSSKQQGIFKQVVKALQLLLQNPKHPGLKTHEYSSLPHPFKSGDKVWEAYVQNNTPGAYRIFWCYGAQRDELTIIAITPHP